MTTSAGYWSCEYLKDGPPGFPFAILAAGEVLAWVSRPKDAAFIAEAQSQVRELALAMRELEASRVELESRLVGLLGARGSLAGSRLARKARRAALDGPADDAVEHQSKKREE